MRKRSRNMLLPVRRVLVFGSYDGEIDGKPLEHGITPLGFVLLANPIREAAKETFEYFAVSRA